ncbi:hypothetical protein THAR02_03979, partial [Trichoderma harzianum]
NIGNAIIVETHFLAAVLYLLLYSLFSSFFFASSANLSCCCASRRMRAARSAESRASAVRRAAAAEDAVPAPASATTVPVADVVGEDTRGEDLDPGADLFTALEALAFAFAELLLVVAYPLVGACVEAKLRSEPLFVRWQSFSRTCLS